MSVRLTVKQRSEQGGAEKASEVLLREDVITLGRDPACQVVLAQQAVSRSHARLSRDGALYFVEDLGSSFGTQLNGEKLKKHEKRLLRNGDIIAIAQFDLTFDRVADEPSEGGDRTQVVAKKVVKDVMRGLSVKGEQPYFRVMNGPREGEKIEIAEAQEYIVGRDEAADIILNDDLVSRKHVKVRRDWSGVHVEDLNSRNGIRVNRQKTPSKTLQDRDEVEIGNVRLLFLDPNEVREAPVVLPEKPEPEGESTEAEPDDAPSYAHGVVGKDGDDPVPEEGEGGEEGAAEGAEGEGEADGAEEGGEEQNPDEVPGGEDDVPPYGEEMNEDEGEEGENPLSNRSTVLAVTVGAIALLIGIVVLILLVVGA